jgi:hypothetical protein
MSSGSTKRGKPSVPVRLELKQLKLGSKPQTGSEKHEQNFNSQEAALGAMNLLDASYGLSKAHFLRGRTPMVTLATKDRITAVEQSAFPQDSRSLRGSGQLGASLETVIRI